MAKNFVTIERLELFWTKVKAYITSYLTDNDYVKDASYVHTDSNYTAAEKEKLAGVETGANKYTLPTASSSTLGGVKTGDNITNTSGTISITKTNVTSALGYTPPTSDTTYNNATTSAAGLMSASDKSKLDGIADTVDQLPDTYVQKSGDTMTGGLTTPTLTTPTLLVKYNAQDSGSGIITLVHQDKQTSLYFDEGANSPAFYTEGEGFGFMNGEIGLIPITIGEPLSDSNAATKKYVDDAIIERTNKYTLPAASSSTLGGVKVGSNISVASDGTISVPAMDWSNIENKPTKLSEFTNDGIFITKAVSDLTNYYKKSEVYTQDEVNDLISQITGISVEVVTALPTTGTNGVIYLVAHSHGTNDAYDEYVWVASKSAFEKIGTTDIDLSNYWIKTDLAECTEDEVVALFS